MTKGLDPTTTLVKDISQELIDVISPALSLDEALQYMEDSTDLGWKYYPVLDEDKASERILCP